MKKLIINKPDDFHLHCRDGEKLLRTVSDAAHRFARALIMPNLTPPITNLSLVNTYYDRIINAIPDNLAFQPLMSLYLTDNTPAEVVQEAKHSVSVHAFKLYPAGVTTNSDEGVTDIRNIDAILKEMQRLQIPLLIHGEVNDPQVDIFDREKIFIEQILEPLVIKYPELPIVLEHITTKTAVDFIVNASKHVAATITAHHLLINRNNMLAGGVKPHFYCLPILKRSEDQIALVNAATSGNPKFFLGSDSAPHSQTSKEASCGCAGIYTGHAAIELYAQVFEDAGALDKLEGFASQFGADFYGLPHNTEKLTLVKETQTIAEHLDFGDNEVVVPFGAGQELAWSIK